MLFCLKITKIWIFLLKKHKFNTYLKYTTRLGFRTSYAVNAWNKSHFFTVCNARIILSFENMFSSLRLLENKVKPIDTKD